MPPETMTGTQSRKAAEDTLTAYRAWVRGETVRGDWTDWAERLALTLADLLEDGNRR